MNITTIHQISSNSCTPVQLPKLLKFKWYPDVVELQATFNTQCMKETFHIASLFWMKGSGWPGRNSGSAATKGPNAAWTAWPVGASWCACPGTCWSLWSPIECCLFSTGDLVLHSNFCFAWPGLETIDASGHQFQFRYLINVLVGEVINSPCTVYTFS